MQNQFSIPDIIDNSPNKPKLFEVLNALLNSGSKAHFATAYFNLNGYELIREKLNEAAEFYLLLGNESTIEDLLGKLREEAESIMDQPQTLPIVKEFVELLQRDTTQVRRYNKGFFHGKVYLIDGVQMLGSVVISGSSNFTAAGLTSNSELNSVHKQESTVNDLKNWFNRLWDESENYKDKLIELLTNFTVQYTPYDIYIKTLHEYLSDKFDVDISLDEEMPSPIQLADFQHDGYAAAKDILERYGGVLIADSVGLGKTYLGLKLLDDYAYRLRQKSAGSLSCTIGGYHMGQKTWRVRHSRRYSFSGGYGTIHLSSGSVSRIRPHIGR